MTINPVLELTDIRKCCQSSPIGKLLPDALYVHESAVHELDETLQVWCQEACQQLPEGTPYTLVKLQFARTKVSFLHYPDFDSDPHPALAESHQVDVVQRTVEHRNYRSNHNPPILHRKETFVSQGYPLYSQFATLTDQEELLGLLDSPRLIGTRMKWQQRLDHHRVEVVSHLLACPLQQKTTGASLVPKIQRHRAAIIRKALSKPVRLAIEAGFFKPETTYFDYGCGKGEDISHIARLGYSSNGWDPHFQPNANKTFAEIVNLGYVINVIENLSERRQALLDAWNLTQRVLIVAAQVLINDASSGQIAYGDGVITRRNTFQKYYEQEELKSYIDQVLSVDAVPVSLGIYFVFRDEAQAQAFRASRFRSRATTPRIRKPVKLFEDYRELLTPLMDFVTERGRLPRKGEIASEADLLDEFGSLHRAFQVILQVTNLSEWDAIADRHRNDLLVYLALTQFSRRPRLKDLAPETQQDILALFGSYREACSRADAMLFSLGDREIVSEHCRTSTIGKRGTESLTVHVSALSALAPLLRLYEGCASRTIGRPEEATLVRFYMKQPKLTYLFVPDFNDNPHPQVLTNMDIDLRRLQVYYRDFHTDSNPPIIHFKEQMVMEDYPNHPKFARLSQQEQDWGLLDDTIKISRLRNWERFLQDRCAELIGHRLVWRKDADPYHIKLLKSEIRSRKKNRRLSNFLDHRD